MKKLAIVGASHFVNRMFEACGNYQWAREFLKNSLEAEATKVEFGIEWQAVEKFGVYRRTVADNGVGMTKDQLLLFFSTLGEGAKRIGGVHDNFGVGAKIASLPWNPQGVVVISYKDGKGSMIRIELNAETAEYELVEFQSQRGASYVINPSEVADWGDDVNWSAVAPEWARQHGTVVVLLGSEEAPDLILGNPRAGEKDIKGLSVYLNTRFWDLRKTEVVVVELRSERKTSWPQGPKDSDDARRPNNRTIMGAKYYLTDVKSQTGKLASSSWLPLDGSRVVTHWFLWDGERPAIHSYAKKPGYIAVRYGDELFELTTHKAHFRWFGIAEVKIQQILRSFLSPSSSTRRSQNGASIQTKAATEFSLLATAIRASRCHSRIGDTSSPIRCPMQFAQLSRKRVAMDRALSTMRSTGVVSKTSLAIGGASSRSCKPRSLTRTTSRSV